MQICPLGAELFNAGRQMDRHDKANNEMSVFHICALNDNSVSTIQPTNAHI